MRAEDIFKNYRIQKARLDFLTEKSNEMEQKIILMKKNILADNQHITSCLDDISRKTDCSFPAAEQYNLV